jgi:hypothetical protein
MNEIFHVLTDPAHWVAEVVMDGTLTLLAVVPARWLVRRHDKKKHGLITQQSEATEPRRTWVPPRGGGYHPTGPAPQNPRPPRGPGAVSTNGLAAKQNGADQ